MARMVVIIIMVAVCCSFLPALASMEKSGPVPSEISGNVSGTEAPMIEWFKTYGQKAEDTALAIIPLGDGTFIVGGSTESPELEVDASWIKRINKLGKTLWTRTFDVITLDEARSIVQTKDGGFILGGAIEPLGEEGPEDAGVLKVDSEGNKTWNMSFGQLSRDETVHSIIHRSDGGYIFAGHSKPEDSENMDALVVCLDENGSVQWFRTFGDLSPEDAQSIIEVPDGFVIAGYQDVTGKGNYDAWVVKINTTGEIVWEKTYGGSERDSAHQIIRADDGGFMVVGENNSHSAGKSDVWVFKLTSDGSLVWEQMIGGQYDDKGYSIQETTDSGYLVAGNTQSYGAGGTDAWVIKLSEEGTPLWSKTIGGTKEDYGSHAIEIRANDIIVSGMTESYGAGEFDAMVTELGYDKE